MLRVAGIALALLMSSTAAAQDRMSDYVRGINEQNCLKRDVQACSELINAGFGVPDATRARALAIRGESRVKASALDGALADLRAALKIAETPQDRAMANLDAARGVSGLTPEWQGSVHANLAAILLRREDKAGARAAVDKAIMLHPANGFAYMVRARLAGAEQRWAAALPDFDKALQLGLQGRDRAWGHYYRALVRAMLKQPFERQLADLTAAIAADPTLPEPYETRGDVYRNLKRYEDALIDYDALIARAPGYAPGYNIACWTRAADLKREFEKARAQCDRALVLAPEANTYDSAGLVALQQGRWQDAWTHYDKAAKGDPKSASAVYGRGIAARRLGRTAAGDTDIAAAKAMDAGVAEAYAAYGQKL